MTPAEKFITLISSTVVSSGFSEGIRNGNIFNSARRNGFDEYVML